MHPRKTPDTEINSVRTLVLALLQQTGGTLLSAGRHRQAPWNVAFLRRATCRRRAVPSHDRHRTLYDEPTGCPFALSHDNTRVIREPHKSVKFCSSRPMIASSVMSVEHHRLFSVQSPRLLYLHALKSLSSLFLSCCHSHSLSRSRFFWLWRSRLGFRSVWVHARIRRRPSKRFVAVLPSFFLA